LIARRQTGDAVPSMTLAPSRWTGVFERLSKYRVPSPSRMDAVYVYAKEPGDRAGPEGNRQVRRSCLRRCSLSPAKKAGMEREYIRAATGFKRRRKRRRAVTS
jgi:hypothetical protein